jgi:hypothetical protein
MFRPLIVTFKEEYVKNTMKITDYIRRNRVLETQCTYNVTLRLVRELLFPWKNNKYYIFVCVCACVCVHARIRACVRARGRVHAHACM